MTITGMDADGAGKHSSRSAKEPQSTGLAAKRRAEDQLDERLEESFPASDPVPLNPGAD